MNSPFKFLRRVRIHGGECGAVARALHHEAQKVALIQNEQSLISDECVLLRQADLEKSSKSTFIERKQMSTKTSIKRIALVAVSALGFGLMSVVPSGAAVGSGALVLGSATLNTATTTYAARVGQQISINITGDIAVGVAAAANDSQGLSVAAAITAQPAGSPIYPTLTVASGTDLGTNLTYQTVGLLHDDADGSGSGLVSTGSATTVATVNHTSDTNEAIVVQAGATLATLSLTPTVKGVYTVVVWNENSGRTVPAVNNTSYTFTQQPALSGAESSQTFTINVVDGISTVAITAVNSTSAIDAGVTGDDYGSLLKVTLKDSSGNLGIPATGESVTLTPSSSTADITFVNNVAVTSAPGAAYILSAGDFGNTGTAWVNVTNSAAATFTVVATYSGSASASVSLTSRTVAANGDFGPIQTGTTGWVQGVAADAGDSGNYDYPVG